jgi:flagellar biosynthesis protein FlhF
MQVKTFEGFTMQEAIKEVRKSFGSDAVILKTKERSIENGKAKVFEVTAAVAGAKKGGVGADSGAGIHDGGELHELALEVIHLRSQLSEFIENNHTKDRMLNLESSLAELRTLLMHNLKNTNGEIYRDMPASVTELIKKLELMGVDDSHLSELVVHLKALDPPQIENRHKVAEELQEFYQVAAIKWMMSRIRIAPELRNISETVGIHVFIGSSGVGKSAMIAKLAAYYGLKEKKNVVIASYDKDRLAATEQMRIYAKVIGVPFVVIDDISDFKKLLSQNIDAQIILVDTSGKCPKRSNFEELNALKNVDAPLDFHLVLSATDKGLQLDRTVRCFSTLGLSSLVFTKLDETWSYGEIFSLSQKWSVPLSYFGIGQGVPDDMERATKERVIERIFGL